jgi:uncharacterized protein YraI
MALGAAAVISAPAAAQPVGSMLSACANVGKTYFRDFDARTDMKYNGQRVDGTHAINGRIFLETRFEDFACSFDPRGQRMTEFFADGRVRNAYLPGGRPSGGGTGSGNQGDRRIVRVVNVPANDVLNVRSGPSARSRIVGALSNGNRVRNLGCRTERGARWCRIEMLDDMRSSGWVNARYLTGQSSSKASSGSGISDEAAAVAVIGAVIGAAALAASSKDHRHENHRPHSGPNHSYGAPFSPNDKVTCYPRERTCYRRNGRVAANATRRYFQ